jgi:hypothetical protein
MPWMTYKSLNVITISKLTCNGKENVTQISNKVRQALAELD